MHPLHQASFTVFYGLQRNPPLQVSGGLQAEQVAVAIVGRAVMYDFVGKVCAETKKKDESASSRRLTSLRSKANGDDDQDGQKGKEHSTTTTT